MTTKKFKIKSIITLLCVFLILTFTTGFGVKLFSAPNSSASTQPAAELGIVEITEERGTLSSEQIRLLSRGALIRCDSAVFQLSSATDNGFVYSCLSDFGLAEQRSLSVNLTEKTYSTSVSQSDLVHSSDLLKYANASALLQYALASDLNLFVEVNGSSGTFSADDVKKLEKGAVIINDVSVYQLASKTNSEWTYVLPNNGGVGNKVITYTVATSKWAYSNKNYSFSPTVSSQKQLQPGIALAFSAHRMYVVQCFDSSWNLQKMTIIGGGKAGEECKFAFVIVGDKSDNLTSLVLYQTGSTINLTNLAGTSGNSTGIKPSNDQHFLSYFEIGGNGLA